MSHPHAGSGADSVCPGLMPEPVALWSCPWGAQESAQGGLWSPLQPAPAGGALRLLQDQPAGSSAPVVAAAGDHRHMLAWE